VLKRRYNLASVSVSGEVLAGYEGNRYGWFTTVFWETLDGRSHYQRRVLLLMRRWGQRSNMKLFIISFLVVGYNAHHISVSLVCYLVGLNHLINSISLSDKRQHTLSITRWSVWSQMFWSDFGCVSCVHTLFHVTHQRPVSWTTDHIF